MSKENEIIEDETLEEALVEAVEDSVKQDQQRDKSVESPGEVFVIPLTRRPFFPGMAAPIVIEPGAYYEVLKTVAKSEHKCMGLFLTKKEDVNVYKVGFDDLYEVGVLARILRIIPMEQGGAQVVLNMEKRISIHKPLKSANISRLRSTITKISHEERLLKSSKPIRSASSRRSKSC